ncbi:hypothetical protein ACPZ19_00880 [Amycolatopsis lurida]
MTKNGGTTTTDVADEVRETKSESARTPPSKGGGGGGGLERVTVNLVPRASRALERATQLTGDSKTDTINRALQVLAVLEEAVDNGGELIIRYKSGEQEVVRFV